MTAADGDGDALRVPPWIAAGMPVSPASSQPPVPSPEDPDPVPPDFADDADPGEPAWPADSDGDERAGRREPADPGRRRLTLMLIASGLVVLAIFVVGALRDKDRTDPYSVGAAGVTGSPAPPSASPTQETTPSPSAAGTPSASPTRSEYRSPSPSSSPSPTPTPTPTPTPIRFGPVTFEAEADGNTIGGSAWVAQYPGASGGRIVRNIGDWGSRQGDGFLRFEDVTVPVEGTYTLKVFHVSIDNEPTRTVVIAVSGGDPRSFTFNGGSTCCTASTVQVDLRKGRNTITIGNPNGHAPSVDRIVLSLP
ncbi:hypothetical protein [Dactylosporangium sp. NPDC048998]|uniref:hypothetical protein n=1 Tax=Dactylosporangium sp. NPDC048998 TaxID=3363976 RepID=UPI003719B5C8